MYLPHGSIRTVIVDDEWHARIHLRNVIEANFPTITIVGEAEKVPDAAHLIHKVSPDLIFLDIHMPLYEGTDLFKFFTPNALHHKVIFTTAYEHYAIRAYEFGPLDYILKPVTADAVKRAMLKIPTPEDRQNNNAFSESLITVSTTEGTTILDINQIISLEAAGPYTNITLKNNDKIMVSKRLNEFERLEKYAFLRIHRSCIINLQSIQDLLPPDRVRLSNNTEYAISDEKRRRLHEWINQHSL